MESMSAANLREIFTINLQRVAARIAVCHPNIVVAGDQGFAASQIIKQPQTFLKMITGANVTRQDQEIGDLLA
jgi:hypothetical protein